LTDNQKTTVYVRGEGETLHAINLPGRVTFQVINVALLAFLIIIASASVIELAARVSTQSYIDEKIDSVNSQFVSALNPTTISQLSSGSIAAAQIASTSPTLTGEAADATRLNTESQIQQERSRLTSDQLQVISDELKLKKYKLSRYETLRDKLFALQFVGAQKNVTTIATIQTEIAEIAGLGPEAVQEDNSNASIVMMPTDLGREIEGNPPPAAAGENNIDAVDGAEEQKPSDPKDDSEGSNWFWYLSFSRMPSDTLLVWAVVSCGALGAAIGGVREDLTFGAFNPAPFNSDERELIKSNTRFARIGLGMAAGFVTFLALKGGKFLFVIEFADGNAPINPYASAFAGILTGLFTERVYQFFTKLIDRTEANLLGPADAQKQKSE